MGRARRAEATVEQEEDREAHEWILRKAALVESAEGLIDRSIREIEKSYTAAFASRVVPYLKKAKKQVGELAKGGK